MSTFTLVFLVALAAGTLLQLWLLQRQASYVRAHREEVPEAFRERLSLEAHRKAADYTVANSSFHRVELIFNAVVLLGWTLGGGLELLDRVWRGFGFSPLMTGVGFLVSLFLVGAVLELPLSAYHSFVLEERFGFNRTTPGLFVADLLKQTVLMTALGVPMGALVLYLMERSGSLWWVYVWAVWLGFGLLMAWAFPRFIAPLFNKFSPLEDLALRERIQALLTRCGFTSQGIFVMDGSRRSAHGNAYFTGFGANKRIVFFDTLISLLTPAEIEAVLAHELGHFKRRHVLKMMGTTAVWSLAGLALLGYLIDQPWFYTGLGMSTPSLYAALALFVLVVPVFTLFLQPIGTYFSRKHEFEADDFAAEQVDTRELSRALVKLYEENATTLTPDPMYTAFHYSHPPAAVRVAHLEARAAGRQSYRS